MSKKKSKNKPDKTKNSKKSKANGLGIGGGNGNIGFPGNQAGPLAQSISTPNDTFRNLRWFFISNDRQFLSQLYVEISLVKTVCDVPVDDAMRGGIQLKSKQLNEVQLEELSNSLDRDDDLNTTAQAAKWDRLYGGAGILILTDQDPETPLDLSAIGPDEHLEFRAVDMWELFWDKQNTEGFDSTLQEYSFEYYSYYSIRVHKSRVMRLKGLTAPSFLRPRLRGWGFSVAEGLIRSLNQYLRATDVMYEVLNEFKLDIFKVKNLINTLLSPEGDQEVSKRIAQLNRTKNFQNAMIMDTEDDYVQKQLSFSGMGDALEQIRMQVAADMRMPMIKLFGIASSGLNATDESGIEVYNSMVESEVRNKIKYHILRMCEIKCQKMFGFVPDDLSLEFKPLRVMSAEQEENVKTQKFNRIMLAKQNGEVTTQEFRDDCNRGKLFDITFDTAQDDLGGYMQDKIEEGSNDPFDPKDVDDPGSSRIDTQKTRPTAENPKSEAPLLKNSSLFDKASYEADGGDKWIDSRRMPFFDKSKAKDKGLWSQCESESKQIYGKENPKFTVWLYSKKGGKF